MENQGVEIRQWGRVYLHGDEEFCGSVGIKRELIVPYKPKKNGVEKGKNKTIVGAARAMLHDQSLPFFLWVEACNTIVYL